MRMHICTHGQQTDGAEINQTVTLRSRFAYKRFIATLDKPSLLSIKFFVMRLNNKCINPSKQLHSDVTFLE